MSTPPIEPWWAKHAVMIAVTVINGIVTSLNVWGARWASHGEHDENKAITKRVDAKVDALHERMNGGLDQRIDERIRLARDGE